MSEGQDFSQFIKTVKIPLLILDQKWHRLFALGGKPDEVSKIEAKEGALIKREAELKQEIKDLKRVKESLLESVMNNMDSTSDLISKKLDDDKRLLEECNERLTSSEDELLELPKMLDEVNKSLMLSTMTYCYDKLRKNTTEAEEIADWIKDVRIQLKKNIIRKNNRQINNKEIYSYMHDVFGMDVLNIFDVKNGNFLLGDICDKPEDGTSFTSSPTLDETKLEDIDLDQIEGEKAPDNNISDAANNIKD